MLKPSPLGRSPRFSAYLAVFVMCAALPVAAGQLAPADIVSRFDELEVESIDFNIAIALDTLPDSGAQNWFSAGNQASGHIQILRSFEFDALMCREIRFVCKQDGFTDQRTISFCRDEDFSWRPLTFRLQSAQ